MPGERRFDARETRRNRKGVALDCAARAGQQTGRAGSVGACVAVGSAGRRRRRCREGRARVAQASAGDRRADPGVPAASQALGLELARRAGRSGSGAGVDIRLEEVTERGQKRCERCRPYRPGFSAFRSSVWKTFWVVRSLFALPRRAVGRAVTWGRRPPQWACALHHRVARPRGPTAPLATADVAILREAKL